MPFTGGRTSLIARAQGLRPESIRTKGLWGARTTGTGYVRRGSGKTWDMWPGFQVREALWNHKSVMG